MATAVLENNKRTMRTVKLKKLTLEDFKGRSTVVEFKDQTTVLKGTNKAGKSTLTNAFFWLLTGVDALDRTNYDLYDNLKEFTPENATPAVVEGVFDVDGEEYTFKRSAKQKWTRPRGKAEYEKAKSDEYLFYVDGLAVNAQAYRDRVESIFAPIDKLKLILNVRHYQLLDWKVLRKHFADMVGDIDPHELRDDYTAIDGLLAKYKTTDAVKEYLRQEKAPIKREATEIEAEIKGMQQMLPDISDVEEAETEIHYRRERIAQIDNEIIGLGEANKPYIEKRNTELAAIREKKEELAKLRGEWELEQGTEVRNLRQQLADIENQNREIVKANAAIEHKREEIQHQISIFEQQVQLAEEDLVRMRAEKDKIKARVFNEHCPTCGQTLPYEMIAEERQKFHDRRDKELADIIELGQRKKANQDKTKELIATLKQELGNVGEPKPLWDSMVLQWQIQKAQEKVVSFEKSQMYGILTNQIELLENNLTVIPEVNSSELLAEKAEINAKIAELQKVVAKRSLREENEKKIELKQVAQKQIGAELARLEGLENLCIMREREWANIVRNRANKYLTYAHVEMTEIAKSGEINDICTLSAKQVTADGTNTADQVLIGIDVSKAFQKYFDINVPIFIDNAEQIVSGNYPVLDNQTIRLYVDESYPKLTIV